MTKSKETRNRFSVTVTEDKMAELENFMLSQNIKSKSDAISKLLANLKKADELEKRFKELEELNKQSKDQFEFTQDIEDKINEALSVSDVTREEIIKNGTLAEAKKTISISKKVAELENLNTEELRRAAYKGVAEFRIQQTIDKVMAYNDKQTEKENKYFITPTIVHKLSGSNFKGINEFFDKYRIMIDDHNNKHGLTLKDNRKGKGKNIDLKELMGI